MIISPSRKFIFIHLEKCGGTSVETALQPYLHWSDIIIGSTTYGERYQQNLYDRYSIEEVNKDMLWKHSTAQQIEHFILPENWKEYKKISVVRDPIDLVRSLYFFSQTSVKYHIGRVNKQRWKEMLRTKNFPNAWPYTEGYVHAYADSVVNGSGINGFTKYILDKNFPFIQPQSDRLSSKRNKDLGLVKDLSMLNEEWQDVLDAAGIEDNVCLEKLNQSDKEENLDMSLKTKKLIKKHFVKDYLILPKYTGVHWG